MTITQHATGIDSSVFYDWTAGTAASDWANAYPQCLDGSCTLELTRIDQATGVRLACFDNPEACTGWLTDPDKATKYECQYAGAVLALAECNIYGPTFERDKAGTGQTVGDPVTGEPGPPVGVAPGPGTGLEGCPPPFEFTLGGFGYWVTKGVSCALAWAFVPSPTVLTDQFTTTKETITSRPPVSVVAIAQPALDGLAEGWAGGCDTVLADFNPPGQTDLVIPCDPPAWSGFGAAYVLMALILVLSTTLALWHLAVAALGGKVAEA